MLDTNTLHRCLLQLTQKDERAEIDSSRSAKVEEMNDQRNCCCDETEQYKWVEKRHCDRENGAWQRKRRARIATVARDERFHRSQSHFSKSCQLHR